MIFYSLILISMMISISFLFMKHPMSMGLILLMQTIMISLITGFYLYSYWFSYILFLIMVGGMMVLFIYMTSLASNEMFSFSFKKLLMLMMMFMMMMMILIMIDKMSMMYTFKNIDNYMNLLMNENFSINKIYNKPNNFITIMLMNYLFLTLIAVVKITNLKMGPLRQMN
uniref:NADH-ubiquinone oxidoreductase chain 6 n=1 Tax=Sphaerius sp. BT0074 TaxID=546487 RepID=B6D8V4_9COLE|nr:NADH dehydrogenase subunit 6 [Sphaerius sp. BT0074]ACF35092.1 NADH dehydrogenase subunit 6 [Sphaerius sp. BT0074]